MSDVKILPIFNLIQEKGNISTRDMYNTFNMGVGMSIVLKKEDEEEALNILKAYGQEAYRLGVIVKSEEKIILE